MRPPDVALVADGPVASDAVADEFVVRLTHRRKQMQRQWGAVATAAGAVVLLVALWGVRQWAAPWRSVVGLIGALAMWAGLQQLGRARYGARFKLGLIVAFGWLTLVVLLAATADLLPIEGVDAATSDRNARPALELAEPLGTDDFGRSLLSRTIYGARVSLLIGFGAAVLGMVVGGALGMLAGYLGRWIDTVVGVLTNTMLAFPPLILLLAMVTVLEPTVTNLTLGLAILTIPTFARLARAQTLVYAQREFVLAARAMGARASRILIREIVPNIVVPMASFAFLVIAVLIVAEGSLSFIGLGIRAPRPSWGGMVAKGQPRLKTDPHLVFVPAAAMFLSVLAINRAGEWARQRAGGRDAKL